MVLNVSSPRVPKVPEVRATSVSSSSPDRIVARMNRSFSSSSTCGPLLLFLVACSSVPGLPAGSSLSPREIEYQRQLELSQQSLYEIEDRTELLIRLDQNLAHWNRGNVEQLGSEDRELVHNLEEVLQRTVYFNFRSVLSILETGEPHQQCTAAAAIGFARLQEPADTQERARFLEQWPQLYPRAIPVLIRLLGAEQPYVVQNSLLGLWKLADPNTPVQPILPLLNREEEDIRANAALALSTILTPETGEPAISALINALYDPMPKVRVHAVTAVGAIKHPSAAGRLAQLLDDHYMLVQANAAQALGKLGAVENCQYLLGRLDTLMRDTPNGKFRKRTDLDQRREFVASHLIASLEQLSGKQYGDDLEKWREWWLEESPR